MLKRLFGGGRRAAPTVPAPVLRGPRWVVAETSDADRFALHLHGVTLDEAERLVRERYLLHVEPGRVGALLSPHGTWVSVRFPREVVQGVGFNREASGIAAETGEWVIGYRGFVGEGIDVHFFHAGEHVAQLALSGDELEWEPESAAPFAPLADVGHVVPRPATQHPLDFLFALLAALGLSDASLTWEEALAHRAVGELAGGRVLEGGDQSRS